MSLYRIRRAWARHRDLSRNARSLSVRVEIYMDPQFLHSEPDHVIHMNGFGRVDRDTRKRLRRKLRDYYLAERYGWPWADDPKALAEHRRREAVRLRRHAQRLQVKAEQLDQRQESTR